MTCALFQFVLFFVVLFAFVSCEEERDDDDTIAGALEQGRTFVHHAMKRLAILVPVLMFKFGVMFTLLVVATLTSTKGLMVGSLLLALGVGHFIANKFTGGQATHAHITVPAAVGAAPWPHYVDRAGYVQDAAQAQAYGAWQRQ